MQTIGLFRLTGRSFHVRRELLSSNPKGKSAKNVIQFLTGNTNKVGSNQKDKVIPLWKQRDETTKKKIKGERWNPSKRLSREGIENVRLLKQQMPHLTASDLGTHFKISPDAIRRILKSNFRQTEEESVNIQKRWKRRGEMIKQLHEDKTFDLKQDEIPITRKIRLHFNSQSNTMEKTSIRKQFIPQNNSTKTKNVNKLAFLSKVVDNN
ncbi:similar to Saccharomyces cerevisiae YNL213C RRG9 Protein of unknown function [Maudiozyma saulgeensis]|uniref:Required for respiratory growth protein 9, mitochondrial n=1 Tax=Maudiozyma saulgeensis TaxID=1789683 RepID=A0A1X7R286_9SACH|nr:similar to Saccharomyces cerevisiae YNL213C RRG9 Protein of unknown function [Kazachstania saulgeensis]